MIGVLLIALTGTLGIAFFVAAICLKGSESEDRRREWRHRHSRVPGGRSPRKTKSP